MCIIYVIEGWECLLSNLYFLTTRIESQWLLTYDQVPTFREPWSWTSLSHMTTWGPTKSKDTAIAMQLSETNRKFQKKKLQDLEEAKKNETEDKLSNLKEQKHKSSVLWKEVSCSTAHQNLTEVKWNKEQQNTALHRQRQPLNILIIVSNRQTN